MWHATSGRALAVASLVATLAAARPAEAEPPIVLIGVVVAVVDGDTIDVRLSGRVERVRYIGIDAPEIDHPARPGRAARAGAPGGVAAARANAALVAGRSVSLELDVERRDRYGRLLAYVWAGRTLVNAELVRRGHARAWPIPPNLRHATLFAALDAEAAAARSALASAPTASLVHCAHGGGLVSYER